jgi:hypothetical protein
MRERALQALASFGRGAIVFFERERILAFEPLIKLITNTKTGVFAPLDTALGVVVRDKPALVAGRPGVNGKKFYFIAAYGADFYCEGWRVEIVCSGAPVYHYLSCIISLLTTIVTASQGIMLLLPSFPILSFVLCCM